MDEGKLLTSKDLRWITQRLALRLADSRNREDVRLALRVLAGGARPPKGRPPKVSTLDEPDVPEVPEKGLPKLPSTPGPDIKLP